ncbi:DUF4041 domain-containing protein [Glycomyces paridis]|uniref:DUF4041 domain-containing protein n=1 Tax=Glycomyces paridis TaxID=2126555 RepID=UPI001956A1B5|nr:DUF4041 domain-containing protein [Glycomyces paridis]
MTHRFNAPPGWPVAPGWTPPEHWQQPPTWPSAPPGWQWWVEVAPSAEAPHVPAQTAPAPAPVAPGPAPVPTPPSAPATSNGLVNPDLRQLLDTPVAAVAADNGLGNRKARLESQVAALTAFAGRLQRALAANVGELQALGGLEASELQVEIGRRKALVDHLETQARAATATAEAAAAEQLRQLRVQTQNAGVELHRIGIGIEIEQAKADLVETRDTVLLQEAGIYEYNHPLQDAVAYKMRLEHIKEQYKLLVRHDLAFTAVTNWQVNGSEAQGRKMVRETAKLMLRAYNADADSLVRTMKPYKLDSALTRLGKTRETIARLGSTMQIRITDEYHRFRLDELRLTADHLVKTAEEKERIREERALEREEERAQREMLKEREKLDKERSHLMTAIAKLEASGDTAAVAELTAKLDQVEAAFEDVLTRQANSAAGFVYVISNRGAFGPDMVKIGMTRRLEPMDRVNELGDASVPFRFDVHALVFSEDARGLEARLHEAFAQ